jgi:hypothetical protein
LHRERDNGKAVSTRHSPRKDKTAMNLIEHAVLRLKMATDRRYRQFFLQRMVKDRATRERWADAVAARLPAYSGDRSPSDSDHARALKQQGYAVLPSLIRADWLSDMVAYFSEQECADPYRPEIGTFRANDNVPGGTHVAFFPIDAVIAAPHVFAIGNDPHVLAIVADALGAKPTISYMTAWWSLPAGDGTAQHAERFHRDVDDWRFVKLFCYLTDVDEAAGPHVFVRGSHRINQFTDIRRFTDEEVGSAFATDDIVAFTGPAGTWFLENTSGIHRGIPAIGKPRLIFQVLYSLRPVIYGPKAPVARLGQAGVPGDLDRYVNRVYCAG